MTATYIKDFTVQFRTDMKLISALIRLKDIRGMKKYQYPYFLFR